MKRVLNLVLRIILTSGVLLNLQAAEAQIPDNLINGTSGAEMSRRIFRGERDTMERLKMYSPLVDTYIQSVWPDTAGQMPLDDIYSLSKISFSRFLSQQDDAWVPLFGRDKAWQVVIDNGQKATLYPSGFMALMFVDPWDFDSDTYRLAYLATAKLGTIDCFTFAVAPTKRRSPRRFEGTIWVEQSGLRIVRAQGTFQGEHSKFLQKLSPLGGFATFYLHFDCWRRQIAADLWVPASVTVDDNVSWKVIAGDGTTDQHFRSRTLIWGYSHMGSFQSSLMSVSKNNFESDSDLDGLEADGLLAPAGEVEQSLNAMIRQISDSESAQVQIPVVTCRVLLTTPIEIFHLNRTILVSRGLLEMVPDVATLKGLLGRELAHVVVDSTANVPFDYTQSLFSAKRSTEFAGFGISRSQEEETRAGKITGDMVEDSYSPSEKAAAFAMQLRVVSHQIPNIIKGRFGPGLIDHELTSTRLSTRQSPLALHYRYEVDTSTGELRIIR